MKSQGKPGKSFFEKAYEPWIGFIGFVAIAIL